LPTGALGITPGPVHAAADEVYITVRGTGGHGAYPHKGVDAIPAAAATVLALQNIAARETDPLASVVVTIGTIAGGYRQNVLAEKVELGGTIRTYDPALRAEVEARVRRIVDGVAAAYNAHAEVRIVRGYPPVVNDARLAAAFTARVRERLGIVPAELPPTMGAEDFAYYAERVRGLEVRLGIYNEGFGSIHSIHSARFRFDEGAVPTGIATLVSFAEGVGDGSLLA
jgi:amidohydrolase